MKNTTTIELTQDELIVLSHLIHRVNSKGILNDFFEDQSEQRALWNLESILEKNNDFILDGEYSLILKSAMDNSRDEV